MSESRLAKYLQARARGGHGWARDYEQRLRAINADWLAGHYAGLLGDALRLLGSPQLQALEAAVWADDERIRSTEDT